MNFKLPKGEDWVFPFLTNSTFQPSLGLMYWPIDGVLESHLEKFTRSNWILIFKKQTQGLTLPNTWCLPVRGQTLSHVSHHCEQQEGGAVLWEE